MSAQQPVTAVPAHVLERAEMRAALASHDFGVVFALARKWGGISYSKIADACGIKPERVGALARGSGSITTFEKIAVIADALRIPGHLLGLAGRAWEQDSGMPQTIDADLADGDDAVLRRDLLRVAALGTGMAVGMSSLGSATLSVLAEQAQQAGWAAFDAGDQGAAARLYDFSYRAATEAADGPLAGNALAFRAYQRSGFDRRAAVETAEQSCVEAGSSAPAGVRALLSERLAWAYAVSGDVGETERALGIAERALADAETEPGPDWAAWVDANELRIMTGRCWTELRRPMRAVPILEDVLGGFDDSHARDKALYLSFLADAYLTGGEIEQAVTVADRVLDLADGVASVRPMERMAPVLKRMVPHRDLPVVDALLDRVRDLAKVSPSLGPAKTCRRPNRQ